MFHDSLCNDWERRRAWSRMLARSTWLPDFFCVTASTMDFIKHVTQVAEILVLGPGPANRWFIHARSVAVRILLLSFPRKGESSESQNTYWVFFSSSHKLPYTLYRLWNSTHSVTKLQDWAVDIWPELKPENEIRKKRTASVDRFYDATALILR